MASFRFDVDTYEMAAEIQSVSRNVNNVSGAVTAMKSAVIAAEQEGAEIVCQNVNRGFYTLMHSQISQKIAHLTSVVEAKLMELGYHANALRNIQSRMTKDYNMISSRYTKAFASLNHTLESRVAELDMPVFKLVNRDVKRIDCRIGHNSARFAVNQLESVLASQLISASKIKQDADSTLTEIARYVKDSHAQSQKSDKSMLDKKIEFAEDLYVPVSIVESATSIGNPSVNYYVARSGNPDIDKNIDASVREQSINSVLNGNWKDIDEKTMTRVSSEFQNILNSFGGDERIKDEIARMFAMTNNVQQLNPDTDEL